MIIPPIHYCSFPNIPLQKTELEESLFSQLTGELQENTEIAPFFLGVNKIEEVAAPVIHSVSSFSTSSSQPFSNRQEEELILLGRKRYSHRKKLNSSYPKIRKIWTRAEKEILSLHSKKNLDELVQMLPGRTRNTINVQRNKLLIMGKEAFVRKPYKRKAWTQEEDNILREYIHHNRKLDKNTWQELSIKLKNRSFGSLSKRFVDLRYAYIHSVFKRKTI